MIVVLAVLAPWLAPYPLHQQVGPVFGHPSWSHPLGLDDGGIDMVSLLMWGARISLVVGFAATAVSMLIGGTVGILSGYFGGSTDTVLMRITDYFLVIPDMPLMIVVAAVWGPSLSHIILVIGLLLLDRDRTGDQGAGEERARAGLRPARAVARRRPHADRSSGTCCRRSRRCWSPTRC